MTVDVYCVPDTNFFHHFQFFADVDWLNLMQAPLVNVVLTAPVLEELERHKNDSTSNRRRNRSRSALRKFDELLEKSQDGTSAKLRDRTFLKVDLEAVDESFYADGLDSRLPDDRIIAHALRVRDKTGQHVVLITDDMGMRIKASTRGLEVLRPPQGLQLDDEPTDSEREVRRLESELASLRSRVPQLTVCFTNAGLAHSLAVTFRDAGTSVDDIDRQVHEAERLLRRKYHLPGVVPAALDYSGIADRVAKYIVKYREYLEKLDRHHRFIASLVRLDLTISNEGSALGRDVVIELEAPDDTRLVLEHELPDEPRAPPEPHLGGIDLDMAAFLGQPMTPINDWCKHTSTEASCEVDKVIHNMRVGLDPIWLHLPRKMRTPPCEIAYTLHAGNAPTPVVGILTVGEVESHAAATDRHE